MKKIMMLAVLAAVMAIAVIACAAPAAVQPTAVPAAATAVPAAATAVPAAPTTAPAATEAPTVAAAATEAPTTDASAATAVPTPTIPPPVLTTAEGCAPNSTQVVWFIGLGAGSQPDDVKKEKAWADKYNASQTEACVILNVVYNTGQNSYDALRAQIAAGNAPDIVGVTGKAGRASFQGAWADIEQR
jgi:maltose-binding protein MalE